MIDTTLKCYIKNKLIYTIKLEMRKERLEEQLKNNRLEYTSTQTGGTEIIYLDKFDKIDFDKDLDLEFMIKDK